MRPEKPKLVVGPGVVLCWSAGALSFLGDWPPAKLAAPPETNSFQPLYAERFQWPGEVLHAGGVAGREARRLNAIVLVVTTQTKTPVSPARNGCLGAARELFWKT